MVNVIGDLQKMSKWRKRKLGLNCCNKQYHS